MKNPFVDWLIVVDQKIFVFYRDRRNLQEIRIIEGESKTLLMP
jgi:hypothetical protein